MDVITDVLGGHAIWDGQGIDDGFAPGRRYVWQCLKCNHIVCLNINLLDEDEEE